MFHLFTQPSERIGANNRNIVAALLTTTTLTAVPLLAHGQAASPPPETANDTTEVIVTATKRSETLQKVPMSVEVLDSKKLSQLNVVGFQDYVKYLPSVTFQSLAPNQTDIFMRGISAGGTQNHSGPLPSVGAYLDEQPITTIAGTLDLHVYDVARIEALPGPQGTLYGASSEAGTLRIITNKPTTAGFAAGYDVQANTVDQGGQGYVLEGFVNVPVSSNVAVRLVGFDEHDAGYIDNVASSVTYPTSGATVTNAAFVKKDFNTADSYGGRAALNWDIDADWSALVSLVGQDLTTKGVFGYEPSIGYLETARFQPDTDHDRWLQAALTLSGKLGKYDLTYSGGYFKRLVDETSDYTDYSIAYDGAFGSGAFWQGANGQPIADPAEEIVETDRFTKQSNELRLASPSTDRLRFIAGLFQESQSHEVIQQYLIQGLSPALNAPGWPDSLWLTDQSITDRDAAVFGELAFDITPQLTLTGGMRGYTYKNSILGFNGYGEGYNALTGFSAGMGVDGVNCAAGQTFKTAPCLSVDKPPVTGSGETHKVNLTYKFDGYHLIYATYSTGYRPGGVNRSGDFGPYQADYLTNYELGWKTSWLDRKVHFNGALYDEEWNHFQFSFLGPNSLTIIENAPSARVQGVESNVDWRATDKLTLAANIAYNDAALTQNFCGTTGDPPVLIGSCSTAGAVAVKGQQLPYTPKFKGNLTARYAWDAGPWQAHVQGALLYQTRNYPALRVQDIADLGVMPAYTTADFSVGAEKGAISVELFVKNAFNAHGQANRSTPCTISTCATSTASNAYPDTTYNFVYVTPIQPMTVGIRFGQKF